MILDTKVLLVDSSTVMNLGIPDLDGVGVEQWVDMSIDLSKAFAIRRSVEEGEDGEDRSCIYDHNCNVWIIQTKYEELELLFKKSNDKVQNSKKR